jgi:hypothetical protein
MNEEQLKKLAKLTLLNTQVLAATINTVFRLNEQLLPLLSDQDAAVSLSSAIGQLRSLTDDLSSGLGAAAKDLGVDWAA